jgi:NAD/NADP transhydrogenase beta subunit
MEIKHTLELSPVEKDLAENGFEVIQNLQKAVSKIQGHVTVCLSQTNHDYDFEISDINNAFLLLEGLSTLNQPFAVRIENYYNEEEAE